MGIVYAEKIIQTRRAMQKEVETPYEIGEAIEKGYIFIKYEKVELEEREILDGKVTMLLPVLFQPMTKELMETKYPDPDRPDWLVSNETGEAALGMSVAEGELEEGELEEIAEMMQNQMQRMYPASPIEKESVIGEGKERICWFSLDIPVIDDCCCHILFFREIKGGMLIGSFDCNKNEKKQWKDIWSHLLGTIKDCPDYDNKRNRLNISSYPDKENKGYGSARYI